jgi:hypothetical protein
VTVNVTQTSNVISPGYVIRLPATRDVVGITDNMFTIEQEREPLTIDQG